MNDLVLLDAGPLGLVTNPRHSETSARCKAWMWTLLASGVGVNIPEIADYEIRRELIRAGRRRGLSRLDELADQLGFLPITTDVMRLAAELWAWARNHGLATDDDKSLDGDVILAAQARLATAAGFDVVVATTNSGTWDGSSTRENGPRSRKNEGLDPS
jgi:predicted nucleic acid-binding protein